MHILLLLLAFVSSDANPCLTQIQELTNRWKCDQLRVQIQRLKSFSDSSLVGATCNSAYTKYDRISEAYFRCLGATDHQDPTSCSHNCKKPSEIYQCKRANQLAIASGFADLLSPSCVLAEKSRAADRVQPYIQSPVRAAPTVK